MQITNKTINNAINRKFIKPLNCGCVFNVKKLKNERRVKHNETIGLLTQAHETLINVDYNLRNYNLVDANTLLRASFEYIMMGMMIQFDENIYNEFTIIGLVDRDKTRVWKIIDKFRTHMNKISEPAFKDINCKEKLSMLTELYDKLCNFTHSTLIVSMMTEITNNNEKEIFKLLMYQNYYFLKILLFVCLKYFTNDKEHYLELQDISFSFLFMLFGINERINKHNIDFSKYQDLLYYDKNIQYFEKNKEMSNKLKNDIIEFGEEVKSNEEDFTEMLFDFLK